VPCAGSSATATAARLFLRVQGLIYELAEFARAWPKRLKLYSNCSRFSTIESEPKNPLLVWIGFNSSSYLCVWLGIVTRVDTFIFNSRPNANSEGDQLYHFANICIIYESI
jgi:hypothetical protein